MKLTYTQQGDYLIPDITIRQPRKALGHYGRLRKAYLQEFRPILPELVKRYGITEELKAENQMLWVGKMNMCKAQAEEIVKLELIYD